MGKDKTKEIKENEKESRNIVNKKEKNKIPKKLAIKRIILIVLIILWAVLVFGFSSQTGDESSGLSRKVAEFIFDSEEMINVAEPVIRKLAHFSEYALGGILMYLLVDTYEYSFKIKFLVALFLGIWYAAIDEIHQTFVPDRSGNIIDVCIDTSGFIVGILLTCLYLKLQKKIKLKKEGKKEVVTK